MPQKRQTLLERVLPFVVASLYCGIVAYAVVGIARRAQQELLLARSKKRRGLPAMAALMRGRRG